MTLPLAGTWDIEGADWSTFVLGCCYDGDVARKFNHGDAMIDHMRKKGGVWWGHAMGVYDGLYVLERARARGISCQINRSQHRVNRIVMGSLTLRDSYAIWPVPLDDICGALGRPVPALPWACTCGRNCGGYCRIGPKAAEGDPDLEAYCIADCVALYDGLVTLDRFAESSGIHLRGTLGHTAWTSAQDELGVPDSTIDWSTWRHCRRGDKGGRVTIVRPTATGPGAGGAHWDICNAYPAQLAHAELPVGGATELGSHSVYDALRREQPGIYTLTVRIPDDSFFPPLPWHCGGVLTFPTGTITGSWPLPEIGHALDCGVEILDGHAAIVFDGKAPVFAPLVERWYKIRKETGRKTPLGQWIGRLAKALTGKFAEKPHRTRVAMHPNEIKICTRTGPCADGCSGECGAYEQLDLYGDIWSIPYKRLGPSAYPQWSAYLRAMTRVQLHEQMERFGRDLVFSNTDSLWATGRKVPRPTGSQLGQWEYQHAWHEIEIRSPGVYAFRREPGGPLEIRGIPGLTEADWKRGSGTIERGVLTLGNAVKSTKGLFQKRTRRWSLPNRDRQIYGDRKIGTDGLTWPLDARELRELAIGRRKRAERARPEPLTAKEIEEIRSIARMRKSK